MSQESQPARHNTRAYRNTHTHPHTPAHPLTHPLAHSLAHSPKHTRRHHSIWGEQTLSSLLEDGIGKTSEKLRVGGGHQPGV